MEEDHAGAEEAGEASHALRSPEADHGGKDSRNQAFHHHKVVVINQVTRYDCVDGAENLPTPDMRSRVDAPQGEPKEVPPVSESPVAESSA